MNIQALFTDENRGVSPVIGVILMVAITVILAAVIGAFVLGLGDQASQSAPQASFQYNFDDGGNASITHGGGDNVDNSTIEVRVGSEVMYNASEGAIDSTGTLDNEGWVNDPIRTGDTLTIRNTSATADYSEQTVRIIWNNPAGGSSNTLSERTWP